ncbi:MULTISPECIES: alpha,alpha-trehalose-phosphate synthase (UDP-forming) [Methanobacterium]|jgi:trehalose 6-phosphate synthase|uniref:Trehalose-6-phosphate synthase n=1 Tax=Methanobacterium subterraneum TaxID=59277 RepID=A0A2H4VCF7_9EURY|nr:MULTISPECIES: trehalose-6-phosphate synthase [Methanobacterium]MBW4258134.1 trehalose-6-phosphate synthase [Methanobacterium sp. YSL]PKL72126.1 MAG: trehalose-6-phosphate synthase [Methanobacteriales archaeon HGW-Methanobacteriales-2]AUB55761.1 trehalose-6-phosphate synthase [Methanobacterium subterraneum]AUB57241.1 trehalose-6-phosphate synthase [Methanobacterium sp. MZ-A1]AUB60374.1 trehalose-6-phosphate synthase [Methanobacterium subterraneum]
MNLPNQKKILEFLKDKNFIVASNRGPVEFYKKNSEIEMKRGAGGLVSTLLPLMETLNGVWIASAMTLGDVEVAKQFPDNRVPIPEGNPQFWVPFVVVDRHRYEDYYSIISNPLLWFVQHYMWNNPYTPDIDDEMHNAWEQGYVYLNRKFADKILSESKRNEKEPLIMLQDYHLYLCPTYIREKLKKTFLSQFIHIPWPQTEYFSIIPEYMRKSIVEGLLSNNLLGFHIPRYVTNFLQACEKYADEVNYDQGLVWHKGGLTHVKSYPISVDYEGIKELAASPEVKERENLIRKIKGENFLIYRTDRADLSKNIIRGFKAYDLFLEKYPEYHGKVKFLTTGKPTRQQIDEYNEYYLRTKEIVDEVNAKYGRDGWKPIEWIFKADYNLVVAAFKNYDCLIVNPIADGMNIVPKEASAVNENQGVLILSEKAGCYEELENHVISVNPFDISQTCQAFVQALQMSRTERKERLDNLKEIVAKRTIYHWISEQFEDIEQIKNSMEGE